MSYTKYHYIETALNNIDPKLNIDKFSYKCFAFCYLAYCLNLKENDFKGNLENLILVVNKKENISSFLKRTLGEYMKKEGILNPLKKVSVDELKNYMVNFYAEKRLYSGEKAADVLSTPWEIAKLSTKLLEPEENDTVADFCIGTGSFSFSLLNEYEVKKIEGYEISNELAVVSEMIADVRGFEIEIHNQDLITTPLNNRMYTKIFCDCPFCLNVAHFSKEYSNETLLKNVKKIRSEYMFIQRVIDCLDNSGKAIVLVPLGILNAKDGFLENLISSGYLNAVIQLAPNLLFGTAIPFAILVLSYGNKTLKLINANEMYTKSRLKNQLSLNDINDIANAYFDEDPKTSRCVSFNEIKEKGFNLALCNYFYEKKLSLKGVECKYLPLSELCTKPITRGVQYKAEELDSKESLAPTNIFYLSANAIQDNKILKSLPTITDIEEKHLGYCVEDEDIVIANINTNPVKVAVVNKDKDSQIIAASTLYIVRVNKDIISPYFLKILIESKMGSHIFSVFNTGSIAISVDFLNTVLIPVLEMEDQLKIVNDYNECQKKIDMLKEGILSLENMKSSVLDSFCKEGR